MNLLLFKLEKELVSVMGKPKKRTSHRATGLRRSHLVIKLARSVNGKSPVKAFTTRKEFGNKTAKTATTSQAE